MPHTETAGATVRTSPYLTDGGVPKQYPWLSEDISCDVCVIGGGVAAALCALKLAEKGRSVALLADGAVGFGEDARLPTVAESDFGMTLTSLCRRFDTETSVRLLSLGCEALDELENLCRSLDASEGNECPRSGFRRCDALLFTDDESELALLEREYRARRHNRFDCVYLSRETSRDSFSFDMAGGILGKGMAAALHPYCLTHLALARVERLGGNVFEHTAVVSVEPPRKGGMGVTVFTDGYRRVYADRLVLADGSRGLAAASSDFRRRTRCLSLTRPLQEEEISGLPGRCTVRTFGAPGLRFSFSPDGRLLSEGAECRNLAAAERLREMLQLPPAVDGRLDRLEQATEYLFAALPAPRPAYEYAARYVSLPDGLPMLGSRPDAPHLLYALCTGPSSALFGIIAATLIADLTEGLHRDDLALFPPR